MLHIKLVGYTLKLSKNTLRGYCNYEDGSVQPVVATSSCGEKDQHLHVVHTNDGQVYALHGTEEAIKNLENSTERENVKLQGQVQGEQGAWILYVN